MFNTCPSHLYPHEVFMLLKSKGLGGALGLRLMKENKEMISKYLEHGHHPDECAFDIHHEWKNKKFTVEPTDYLNPVICLGVHQF